MDEICDEGSKDVSISTTNTFLCPKRGYMDIQDQKMEPGDADFSHFEEMFLQDRIIRILTGNCQPSEVSFLYQNENFLYDPSAISYFEEDLESTYIIAPKKSSGEDTVAVLYFPREHLAERVILEGRNSFWVRLWIRLKQILTCRRQKHE